MFDLKSLKTNGKTKKKRVGRGTASGHGKTCCRGNKGQKSRSGGTKGAFFEGGQTPLYRRLPKKRGFKNYPFRQVFQIINLDGLNKFEGQAGLKEFQDAGLMKSGEKIKVLGNGKLEKSIKVTAHAFSASAKKAIETAGGSAVTC